MSIRQWGSGRAPAARSAHSISTTPSLEHLLDAQFVQLLLGVGQAVEVQVVDGHSRGVLLHQHEGRAGDQPLVGQAQAHRDAADQDGLARP